MVSDASADRHYWEDWYATVAAPAIPSQFAVMIAQHFSGRVDRVLDLGCGNGRDTQLFTAFAQVVGVDRSANAIRMARQAVPSASFKVGSVEHVSGGGLLYARFFLHAVEESVEDSLLDTLEGGWHVALEYRTLADESGMKVTGPHYRRYIDTDRLVQKFEGVGFRVEYRIEGRGMARWGADDAHVGRLILVRE